MYLQLVSNFTLAMDPTKWKGQFCIRKELWNQWSTEASTSNRLCKSLVKLGLLLRMRYEVIRGFWEEKGHYLNYIFKGSRLLLWLIVCWLRFWIQCLVYFLPTLANVCWCFYFIKFLKEQLYDEWITRSAHLKGKYRLKN